MNKKIIFTIIGFGLLTWLIPFLASFPFYSPDKGLLINVFLFKSIMIVISALVGLGLLILVFKKAKTGYLKIGLITGLIWLIINFVLDWLILLPMAEMTILTHFTEIGLRYFVIPIYSVGIGYLLTNKK